MGVLIVAGTGTEIGKTHVAEAILLRAGRDRAVLGYKPVESGTAPGDSNADSARLAAASSFHVKHSPAYRFGAPISPHLAARLEGGPIDLRVLRDKVAELEPQVDLLLVELAGGLFSPLTDALVNADFVHGLQEDHPTAKTLLLAPDRLGVLHDVLATTLAAASRGVRIDAVALSAPAQDDASTGTNAAELARLAGLPILGTVSRRSPERLADSSTIARISSELLRF